MLLLARYARSAAITPRIVSMGGLWSGLTSLSRAFVNMEREPIKTSDRMVERNYLTCASENIGKEDALSCF